MVAGSFDSKFMNFVIILNLMKIINFSYPANFLRTL